MDPQQSQQQAMHILAVMLPMMALFGIVFMVILIVPLWQIAKKAGLSGPLSLLALIPGVGLLVALYVIAFMEWRVAPIVVAAYPPTYPPPPAYPPTQP